VPLPLRQVCKSPMELCTGSRSAIRAATMHTTYSSLPGKLDS
jgi:hypothetical protein